MNKVLVIGDGCKDVFQYGRCERLCPEAPVPVFKPLFETWNSGMAVNVYNNLLALGIEAEIFTNSGITKTRYIDEVSNQMLLRIDELDSVSPIHDELVDGIDYEKYEAIVISDYNKGYLTEEHIRHISMRHPLVFMDTKKKLGDWALSANFIKINSREFYENASNSFMENYRNHLIVTEGKRGARWIHSDGYNQFAQMIHIESEHPVRDLSGAGDTFLAGLVAEYVKNNDVISAVDFANKCAAWVVTQKGVVVVDINKI